ncbi:MAG: magnesium transporter CorA family protein [Gemmatimonadaceae bacterium]
MTTPTQPRQQLQAPTRADDGPGRRLPDQHLPQSVYRDGGGQVSRDLAPGRLVTALRSQAPGAMLWVDVDSANRHQHAMLEKVFGFHPLAIEDTLNPESRVKVEEYDGYLFATVRVVRFRDNTAEPYDLETINLYVFLGRNFLVTVHAEALASVTGAAELVARTPDVLARGPARLAHVIMDRAIDAYFPFLDQVDEFVEGLEHRVFAEFDEAALHDIFSVKRLVLSLRRYLAPQRELFNVLTNRPTPFLPLDTQIYFRDIYDHVLRINDSLDNDRELLSSTMDSYLTQVSNRLGMVTKGLTVIATLSVPFVAVSGMWGMNFELIPLATHPLGFWLMLAFQLGIGVALLAVLRWRKLV